MDSNPMVSSLLNKLANYTNLTQGAQEHEEADDDEGPKKKAVKVEQRALFYTMCLSCTVVYIKFSYVQYSCILTVVLLNLLNYHYITGSLTGEALLFVLFSLLTVKVFGKKIKRSCRHGNITYLQTFTVLLFYYFTLLLYTVYKKCIINSHPVAFSFKNIQFCKLNLARELLQIHSVSLYFFVLLFLCLKVRSK